MRLLSSYILIAALAIPLCATADQCNSIPETQAFATSLCECGKSLSRHPIKAPKGMSLVAACRYQKVEFIGTVGDFYFNGNATVSGEIRGVNNPALGDSVIFKAKPAEKLADFAGALKSLKFRSDSGATQKFTLPQLSEESPCWAADVAIKVSRLHVHAGYEDAEDGNYPKEFEIVKAGKYRPCTIEEVEQEDEEE